VKDPHAPESQQELDFDGYFHKEELQMSDTNVDMINSPPHYAQLPIEPHEISGRMPGHEAQTFNYLWRCRYKGTYVEDLKKARWHIETAIEKHLEGKAVYPAWDPHNDEELQLLILQVRPWFPARIGSAMSHLVTGDHSQALRCIDELIDEATPKTPVRANKKTKERK